MNPSCGWKKKLSLKKKHLYQVGVEKNKLNQVEDEKRGELKKRKKEKDKRRIQVEDELFNHCLPLSLSWYKPTFFKEFERSKADACNFIIFSQSAINGGNISLWVGRCIVVFLAGIKSFFFIYYLKKFNKNTKLSIFNYSLYNIEIGTKLRALLLAESSTKIQLFSSRLFKFEFSSLYSRL